MGYTHYWEKPKPFTEENWKAFQEECKKVFEETEIPLADGSGESGTSPKISDSIVAFNGVDEDSHESCAISKLSNLGFEDFGFCKTAEKPYDKIVVKILNLQGNTIPQ